MHLGFKALAFSSSVSAYINVIVLIYLLRDDLKGFVSKSYEHFISLLMCSLSMGVCIYAFHLDRASLQSMTKLSLWEYIIVVYVLCGAVCFALSPWGPFMRYVKKDQPLVD